MRLLAASLVTLLAGPLLYRTLKRRRTTLSLLDGFVVVAITGLVALHILPDAWRHGGWWILAFAAAGLLGPMLVERTFRRLHDTAHIATLGLGLLGLALHALFDGAALEGEAVRAAQAAHPPDGSIHLHGGEGSLLPLAVILHRVPVGLAIWWFVRPLFGVAAGSAALGVVALSTVAGFALAPAVAQRMDAVWLAWFQALVAGSLLHVIYHRPHLHHEDATHGEEDLGAPVYEGIGGLLGLGLLLYLSWSPFEGRIASTFLGLALQTAPALLLGYLMAGLLSVYLPRSSVAWMRRGLPWNQSLRGMAVGLPLPVCSCGVVPLYRTLVQRGAPPAAAMAFLVATPELGLDAVLISIPLLGGAMTGLRVFAAALVALLVGRIVGSLAAPTTRSLDTGSAAAPAPAAGRFARLREALGTGFGESLDHTAPWILLGLLVAAVAAPALEDGRLAAVTPWLQVPLFAVIGMPTYVCAAGATPLIAVLLGSGVSPGAAVAFLLTGPATNVTTFGLLASLHGRRIALVFSASIIALSVAVGWGVDFAVGPVVAALVPDATAAPEASWLEVAALGALTVLVAASIVRRGPRAFVAEIDITGQASACADGDEDDGEDDACGTCCPGGEAAAGEGASEARQDPARRQPVGASGGAPPVPPGRDRGHRAPPP